MYQHKNGLVLRKFEQSDLSILLELKCESWFGTHRISIINSYDQEAWFERISKSNTDIVLIAKNQDQPVGTFKISGIDWMNRSCNVGHDIFVKHRGHGFGNKIVVAGVDFCFEILNMHRLDAEVLENNVASQKTLFGGGFKEEGRRRQAVYKCNQYLDSFVCGIIKEDWLKLERLKTYNGVCNNSYKPLDKK
jgi:RimJ/RimL family protein N-acetyltransferase